VSGRTDAHSYANSSTSDTEADARNPTPTPTPTVTPTPTPSPTLQPVRRRLTVNSGNGDGRYYPGAEVMVTANDPPRRYVFDRWDGDSESLSNPLSSTTAFKMPDRNATITARYKRTSAQ
jgi:Divergent InlB B-repeat domain